MQRAAIRGEEREQRATVSSKQEARYVNIPRCECDVANTSQPGHSLESDRPRLESCYIGYIDEH